MYTDSLSFVCDRSRTIVGVAESIRKICGHRLTEILNSNEGADDRDMANVGRVEALHMCGHGRAVTGSSGEELKAPCEPFRSMGSADRNLGLWGKMRSDRPIRGWHSSVKFGGDRCGMPTTMQAKWHTSFT